MTEEYSSQHLNSAGALEDIAVLLWGDHMPRRHLLPIHKFMASGSFSRAILAHGMSFWTSANK